MLPGSRGALLVFFWLGVGLLPAVVTAKDPCPMRLSCRNEPLKAMRFLASDGDVGGVYQINIFEIYNK